jgi:hypothetical protein
LELINRQARTDLDLRFFFLHPNSAKDSEVTRV